MKRDTVVFIPKFAIGQRIKLTVPNINAKKDWEFGHVRLIKGNFLAASKLAEIKYDVRLDEKLFNQYDWCVPPSYLEETDQ